VDAHIRQIGDFDNGEAVALAPVANGEAADCGIGELHRLRMLRQGLLVRFSRTGKFNFSDSAPKWVTVVPNGTFYNKRNSRP